MQVPTLPQNQVDLDRPVAEYEQLLESAARNRAPKDAVQPFWVRPDEIDLSRWNKAFPVQLLVLEATTAVQASGTELRNVTSHRVHGDWQYTLPVPPEAWTESMAPAVQMAVTQGGIVEEHNGIPLRQIQIRGTTGELPARGRAPQQQTLNVLQAVAGGTLQAVGDIASAFADLRRSATGAAPTNPNTHDPSEFQSNESNGSVLAKTTGYFQILKLKEFFEAYHAIRMEKRGRNLRLALANWKTQEVWLVTLRGFTIPRTANSPLEFPFELNFTAWRRVQLERSSFLAALPRPIRRDPNLLARLITTVQNARRVVQGVSRAAAAAVGDLDRLVLEPLRETVLFAKDANGADLALSELPDAIKKRVAESYVKAVGDAANQIGTQTSAAVKRHLEQGLKLANETKDMVTARGVAAKARALATHPALDPFTRPQTNFEFFESVSVGTLQLPHAVAAQVAKESSRVRMLRRRDFEVRRDSVRAAADRLAVALGAGNTTFEETYGIVVAPIKTTPTDSDWEVLWALNAAAAAMDSLAATGDNEPTSRETAIDVMAGLHRRSGIAFQKPVSKFAVPMPYGQTLEQLAFTYLQDQNRVGEIIALNGLKAPYIDEVGFDIPLLVNSAGREVVIATASIDSRLYVGQPAFVWSNAARRLRGRIQAIRTVGDQTVVELDQDLSGYLVADGAKLSAFLPDTTNSQSLIFIPSDRPPADDSFITKAIPGVDEFDPMVQVGGVDLQLDSTNDLILTEDGDCPLAAGLTNIIQSTRIMIGVQQGQLMGHPAFGVGFKVGNSTAEVSASDYVGAVRRALQQDPTFGNVASVAIAKVAGAAQIRISASIAGTTQLVPISFAI
jgi:hypothetical protein